MKYLSYIALCFLLLTGFISCDKRGEAYKEYLSKGEIYYPGRVDSLTLFTGNLRGQARFKVTTDPKVTKLKLKLRNTLSVNYVESVVDILPDEHGNYKSVDLPNLEEALYTVSVSSFSGQDSSREVITSQYIYGPTYVRSLTNRILTGFNHSNPEVSFIVFKNEPNLPQRGKFFPIQVTEVIYESNNGEVVKVIVSPYDDAVPLTDIKNNSIVRYRTSYMPIEKSLDVFWSEFSEVNFNKP